MKIEREFAPTMTLDELAEKYDLVMVVRERCNSLRPLGLPRYYASFKMVEVKIGGMLGSPCGSGETEEEAISNYGLRISGCFLVKNAYGDDRIDIGVVNIVEE